MKSMDGKGISSMPIQEGIAKGNEISCPDLHIEANYLIRFLKWAKVKGPLKEWIFIFFAGWIIPCALSYYDGVLFPTSDIGTRCFLFDLTMLSFFLIGIPIIVIAEPKVTSSLSYILKYGIKNRVFTIPSEKLKELVEEINCKAKSFKLHLVVIFCAYALTALWMITILTDNIPTWHGVVQTPRASMITTSALYVCLFSYPAALYIFILWGLRYYFYLRLIRNITKYDIRVSPLHPDRCGGLSFFGRASSAGGLIILAVGFCVVFDIINSVSIQGAKATRWDLMAKMVAYLVLGPAFLFTQNLFFTRHLYTAKRKFLNELLELGAISSDNLYKKITKGLLEKEETIEKKFQDKYNEMSDIEHAYKTVRSMRLWPFDLGTLTKYTLMVSTPLMSLILPHIPDWVERFKPIIRRILKP